MTQVLNARALPVALPLTLPTARTGVRKSHGLSGMRLTRRGRVVVVVLGALLVAVITLLGVRAGADGSPQAVEVGRHAVAEGETLWSLAVGLNSGLDVRDVVDEILALNGRTAPTLFAGEVILLPAY